MKTLMRLALVTLIIALALPLSLVGAQEGEGTDVDPVLSAVYLQMATSGTFADNGDESYTLTLEGVGPEVLWLSSSPTLQVFNLSLETLVLNWAAAPDLTTDAVLGVGALNVNLTLGAPVYDAAAGTVSYTAAVSEIVTLEESAKEPEAPEAFEAATLSIKWDLDFATGLEAGRAARYEGTRPPDSPECINYTAQFTALQAQLAANNELKKTTTDPATLSQISYQNFLVMKEMNRIYPLMQTACK